MSIFEKCQVAIASGIAIGLVAGFLVQFLG
jgi:hypothetical protein